MRGYAKQTTVHPDGCVSGIEGWGYTDRKTGVFEIHRSKLRWWRNEAAIKLLKEKKKNETDLY